MYDKHILHTDVLKIDEDRIKNDKQAKHFIKLVYEGKFYKNVYTHFDGFKSDYSKYITLKDALEKIPTNTIRKYFIEAFKFAGLSIIPIINSKGILKLYLMYGIDLYDFKKVSSYVEAQLFHAFGENGFEISHKSKTYTFFIFDDKNKK